MRVTILACVMMAASAAQAAGPTEPVQVTLWERVWTVAPIKERPGSYSAIRDAGDNNPFGRPAIRKSVQAKRAFETATGCKKECCLAILQFRQRPIAQTPADQDQNKSEHAGRG